MSAIIATKFHGIGAVGDMSDCQNAKVIALPLHPGAELEKLARGPGDTVTGAAMVAWQPDVELMVRVTVYVPEIA